MRNGGVERVISRDPPFEIEGKGESDRGLACRRHWMGVGEADGCSWL